MSCRLLEGAANRFEGGRRRTVMHHSLPQGNSARRFTDQPADDGDDRRLDGVHPRRARKSLAWLSGREGWYSCSVIRRRTAPPVALLLTGLLLATALIRGDRVTAAASLQPPDQFIGFKVGADNKLIRWDKIVEYMQLVAASSDRVRLRELGKTNGNNPFIVIEIGSADSIKNLDRQKQLARKLYFQDGAPSTRERDDIFRRGKIVVLLTCSIHANEIGPSQMTLELVHQLATSDSPAVKKILDNVIFLLVPSLNPDGQIMVTDWFNKNLGTPYEASPLPYLYHPYAGHDNNRDMYMFTQKESEYMARLAWHDWFPVVWLDAHQMGMNGPRIFVMPATDPINPNVHPLIYRWNAIFGQSQAAALEAAGKPGIIYNSTYTNFWQGAMAWSGWWHNQIGLLTEIASVRIAAPVVQLRAPTDRFNPAAPEPAGTPPRFDSTPLMPPTDTLARTDYPRPWLGGRWTLRDIVDYQLITTMAMLETAADRRETLLRQIYEVNRTTVEEKRIGDVRGILIPVSGQHDPREVAHLVDRMSLGGIDVFRADAAFEIEEKQYPAGTFVVPMGQVFARYAKDLLEPQTYPEVKRTPESAPEPPYDVTAWSLGMKLGVNVQFVRVPLPENLKLTRVEGEPYVPGRVSGTGSRFAFEYAGADTAIAINKLLRAGARVAFEPPQSQTGSDVPRARVVTANITRDLMDQVARDTGIAVTAEDEPAASARRADISRDPRAADRDVLAVDRRQHRRGMDALGAGTVPVPRDDASQSGHPRRAAAAAVRRDRPARSVAARDSRRFRFADGPSRVSRRHRRCGHGQSGPVRGRRRHAGRDGGSLGSRHRSDCRCRFATCGAICGVTSTSRPGRSCESRSTPRTRSASAWRRDVRVL